MLCISGAQVPVIDTKSCTADFRTNSFVGTEGEWQLPLYHSIFLSRAEPFGDADCVLGSSETTPIQFGFLQSFINSLAHSSLPLLGQTLIYFSFHLLSRLLTTIAGDVLCLSSLCAALIPTTMPLRLTSATTILVFDVRTRIPLNIKPLLDFYAFVHLPSHAMDSRHSDSEIISDGTSKLRRIHCT